MKIIKKINFKGEELKRFIVKLFEEYESRGRVTLAILWAYNFIKSNDVLIQYDFPEIILIGRNQHKDQNFIQERFLGRLVKIQSGLVVFFPGEDLVLESSHRFDFCGIAHLSQSSEFQLYIYGKRNNAFCHTEYRNDEIILWSSYGEPYDGCGGRFLIEPETMRKAQNLFKDS